MGIIQSGILGGFSGKVGTVIGSKWRSKDTIRSRPRKRKKPKFTQKQTLQLAKFKVAATFTQGVRDLLEIGFPSSSNDQTGANRALAAVLKEALTGDYPNYTIAYDKVTLSKGSLYIAWDPKAVSTVLDTIQFTWTTPTGFSKANPKDKVLMIAYSPEFNTAIYKVGAERSVGTDSLIIPGTTGKVVQTWISFVTDDSKDVANSVFAGEVTIS